MRGKKSRVLTGETQCFLAQRTMWLDEVENLSDMVQTLPHGVVLSDATVVTLIAGLLLGYSGRAPNCGGGVSEQRDCYG
ncbi:leucyl-tRNA synthetase [Sesbania bispinosa]|nr:leucyl-tRNA synthetase [Sesbania bispinosa]